MSQEEFLLKWNDHHASFFTIVEDLCRTEQLCDVTLACGGQVFETHKLILSVCSPYFRTLLNSRPDKHPIVYLKDVNPKHLEQLLSYMYRGEINVLQDDLGPLIETARGLQIKGLADAGGSGSDGNSRKEQKSSHNGLPSHPHNQPKRSRTGTPTPAPKMPRIEPSRLAPVPITRVVTPPSISHEPETEDQQPIVEVDPGDNPNVKQEGWMMASHGDDSNEYEIPPDQFEQDMQAEDEQYIQAGNDALTGQQEDRKVSEGDLSSISLNHPDSIAITPSTSMSPGISPPSWEPSSPGVSPPPSSSYPLPLKCPSCEKEFHVPSLLERHMRTHTNERPFQCRLCSRSYSQSGNLNVHLKTIHGVAVDGGRSRSDGEGHRPHKCYICNRMFTTSSNMYQHIRAVHNIAIETSKSPKPSGSMFPFHHQVNVSLPPSLPMLSSAQSSVSSSSPKLDNWAKAQLNELKNMTTSSSSSSMAPLPSLAKYPVPKTVEPTIQDTLQQLSALAGGKSGPGGKGSGVKARSLYLLDQDKPICHKDDDVNNPKIKQECE